MKQKIKLISIKPLKTGKKKYEAKFEITKPNGKKTKRSTKFGAKGMSDFTKHTDVKRRDNYISRHKKDLQTKDPTRAGYLSMYILWNKKTFKASLSDYKRRLNIYNRSGKFPTNIKGSINKFGVPKLNNDLIDGTTFNKLPHEIIEQINYNLYISLINERNNFMLLTQNLLDPELDTFSYTFDWDPNDEMSSDWLYDSYMLLRPEDLTPDIQQAIENFLEGFLYNNRGPNVTNWNNSLKYMYDILNKFSGTDFEHKNAFLHKYSNSFGYKGPTKTIRKQKQKLKQKPKSLLLIKRELKLLHNRIKTNYKINYNTRL
jgi:hypothetical protein